MQYQTLLSLGAGGALVFFVGLALLVAGAIALAILFLWGGTHRQKLKRDRLARERFTGRHVRR